jgi:multidrug efflux pump subunit AcrA (membrane-fusion protein)
VSQKKNIAVIFTVLFGVGVLVGAGWFTRYSTQKQQSDERNAHTQAPSEHASVEKRTSYWTCPMHPQVHAEHQGECPICHMKLVEVKTQDEQPSTASGSGDGRAEVVVSGRQLELVGVQKTLVEKMDLTVHIPIAGRFISSSTVAFQIYETDLRYVKAGLNFTGESGFKPESKLTGTISSVDSIVDPTSRTVRVVGTIRSGPSGIIPETTFRGDLAVILKDVVSIPASSVLHSGKEDLAYMIHGNGRMMPRAVKLGLKTDSYYEVIEGLEPGDYISSGPNFLIDSEAKIRGAAGSGHAHH